MVHIKRSRAVAGYFEDVSPAGGGSFYQQLHAHKTMARCVPDRPHASNASASHANQSYAEFAGRQAAGSRIDYPCRVDLAFSVLSGTAVEWP